MNAILLEQTVNHLTRQVRYWDRRLRLAESVVWVPRGLMLGLVIGIVAAVISRLRPWLFSDEIALATAVITVLSGAGVLAVVWLWPRSTAHAARYFDYRFGLRERISTALELSGGVIPYPDRLAERQLSDAVGTARKVDLRALLPLRARGWELVVLALLSGVLAVLLFSHNPQADELRARRELQNAIDEQAAALEEAVEEIQASESLSEAEKEALTQPLEQALENLQQPGISQQEAVAALAEASETLKNLSEGMLPDQQHAYEEAANSLAGSERTAELAQALRQADLGAAADAMDDMARDLGESDLSPVEQSDLADRLEEAADRLEATNPALAQKLREAAQALREGDIEAAQRALREAAEMMRRQQEQLQQSPLADAAQRAQGEVSESQRELAQAGQQSQQEQMAQESQPGQQSQSGQESQPGQENSSAQAGQQEQAGLAQSGEPQQGAQGQTDQANQSSQPGEGQPGGPPQTEGQPGSEGSSSAGQPQDAASGAGSQQGETEGDSAQASGQSAAQGTSETQNMGGGGAGAGEGEGGAGMDTTTGQQGTGEEISYDNSPSDDEDGLQGYTPENSATTLGGQSEDQVNVGGESSDPEGESVREGEFGPNPSGESRLSYTGVYGSYRGIVSDALESGRIPLDQRDVIHDYFSSLEPE